LLGYADNPSLVESPNWSQTRIRGFPLGEKPSQAENPNQHRF
jgi:hypothetical protein